MPTYSIPGPDGKTYSIEGPEGATREQVIAKIKERNPNLGQQQAAPETSTLGDVAQSFGRGIVKGTIGAAGLVGDVRQFASEKAESFGAPEALTRTIRGRMPTSQTLTSATEKLAGPFEKPKTTAGGYAESIGEFVPTAAIGPEGAMGKVATTVLGGAGAEAGGQLGEATGYPGTGRFLGGLIGGGAAGLGAAETTERALSRALPGIAENRQASRAAFDMIQQSGTHVDPTAATQFVDQLQQTLESQHFITPSGEGRAIFAALDSARDGDLANLMDLHSRLGKVAPDRGELYAAASIARPAIRNFIENLQPPQLLSGNPQFVSQVWQHARDTWRISAKLEELEQAAEVARHRRLATGTGSNWNTLRQEIRKILDSERRSRGYSDEAMQQMERMVEGTIATDLLRMGGKLAPRGAVSSIPTIGAFAIGGAEPASAVALFGTISHFLEGALTQRQMRQLEDLVRRESPIAPQQQRPDWMAIAPAAALRAGAGSALAEPSQSR